MVSSSYTQDLTICPSISFSYVENFIKEKSGSSGKEQLTKGFKYYSEGYIHSVKLYQDVNSCNIKGRCYRSQKKNESPHSVEVWITGDAVQSSKCSCTIGLTGACGHITALLYQLAFYKQINLKTVPTDLAKTSIPQTWHQPRGEKIRGSKVDDIVVQGYDRANPHRPTKGIRSTLYNPLPEGVNFDIDSLVEKAKNREIIFPTVVKLDNTEVQTKFGKFPKGSVLSYQQKLNSDYVLNLMDANEFPDLPVKNLMTNNLNIVLTRDQMTKLENIKVTELQSKEIEENTRLQRMDPRWHMLRKQRITASNVGQIAKRRKDGEPLAERLLSGRHVQTAAMKHGNECENTAANAYSKKMDETVNLYPSGIVISPFCYWIAASPDRKVYCPDRNPAFGLLEIKCPVADDLSQLKYLHNIDGELSLKKNDNYHYQIQTQLAVTGLDWCDFFVWTENASHLETIYFDRVFWESAKDKLDAFFFDFYLQ